MRIALVGPTHPFKGGIAAHTTELAHHLAGAGHEVDLVSWSRLYPGLLYPGRQVVPDGEPDVPVHARTTYPLRWNDPLSWWRTGRRLRHADLLVLVLAVPFQVPALLTLARAARGGGLGVRGGGSGVRGPGPAVVALVHNVRPHEGMPGGAFLMARALRGVDGVLVHSPDQGEQARGMGARAVAVHGLPVHLPGGFPDPREREVSGRAGRAAAGEVRLLAFGLVRHYKGVDLLVEAVREVPGVALTVAGEQWGDAGARVRELASDPAVRDRVDLRPGYLPASGVRGLLAEHDVLALTYRTATASQNVLLAHAHGLPVLASRVGTFPRDVRDGRDGLLVPPEDLPALVDALRHLTEPGVLDRLREGVPVVDPEEPWRGYVGALLSVGAPGGSPRTAQGGEVA